MYHFLLCNCSQQRCAHALIALFAAMNFKSANHETLVYLEWILQMPDTQQLADDHFLMVMLMMMAS